MSTPAGDYRLGPEIIKLVGAQVGVHACMAGVRLAVPLLALQLGHGAAVAGALVALFGVSQILVSMPASRLADRHGLRIPVYAGAVFALVGAIVAGAWLTVPALAVAALLEGLAIAVAVVAIQRQAGRLARNADELRRIFAWASFTPAASNFVGPALTGLAIDAFGFRAAFLLLGLGPLVSWFFVRRAQDQPSPASDTAQRASAWQLLRDATVRRVLLMNWFVSATWEVHAVMVPLVGHQRALSASAIGGILGAFAISAALVRLAVPWLATRIREWALMSGAMVMAALMLLAYPWMVSAWAMGACSVLLGFAVGSVQPLVMSLLHQITPAHQRGQAVGLRLVLINASAISVPIIAGAAGGLVGPGAVFFACAAFMLAGARMATGLRRMALPATH